MGRKKQNNTVIGSYCLIRQKTDKKRWVPGDPSTIYSPAWVVGLSMPGEIKKRASSGFAICSLCLAVPAERSATKERPDCKCQKDAHKFGSDWRDKEVFEWLNKRDQSLNSWRQRKTELLAKLVASTYLENIPTDGRANYVKCTQRWYAILNEATGKDAGEQPVSAWTWALTLDWIQIRQEAYRRGWLKPGGVPADIPDPWAVLRGELKAKKLPPIDKTTVSPCNTTIKGYINSARTVVGPLSRSEYLRGLELPPLTDFLEGKIKLPSPKGHQEIKPAAYRAMYAATEKLKKDNLQLWLVDQMLWRFGCRPIEVFKGLSKWVEHDKDGPMYVLKNRPEDGYYLKAKERAIVRRYRIAPDIWEAMQKVMIADGSIIGASSKTAAENLVKNTHSAWVRQFIPEGKHSNYLLRHYVAGFVQEKYGTQMASLFMGHATSATLSGEKATMTQSRYADSTTPLVAITWEDVAPRE